MLWASKLNDTKKLVVVLENTNIGGAERFASYVAYIARIKGYRVELIYVKGVPEDISNVRLLWDEDLVDANNIVFLSKSTKL